MKFTPDEMAYDPSPAEIERNYVPVPGRGWAAYRRFIRWKRAMVRLAPDVRKAFPDDKSVNEVLRKVIELRAMKVPVKQRKTA